MKKFMFFACAVLMLAFFSPKLEAQSIICSYGVGSGTQPSGITTDNQGNVWVALFMGSEAVEFGNGCVREDVIGLSNDNPNGIAWDGTYVWTGLEASIYVEKENPTETVNTVYPVGSNPRGVVFDGTYIWVANYGSNTVSKILPSTGANLGNFPVGSGPFFMAVNSVTHNVWVANRNSNTVTELSQSGAQLLTVATGNEPEFMASDSAGNMWVSCYASQVVEEISGAGVVVASYGVTGNGQPLGITWGNGILWGVTHSGYLFGIYNNAVHYTFLGGSDYDAVYDPIHNVIWVTDITQGLVTEVSPN